MSSGLSLAIVVHAKASCLGHQTVLSHLTPQLSGRKQQLCLMNFFAWLVILEVYLAPCLGTVNPTHDGDGGLPVTQS